MGKRNRRSKNNKAARQGQPGSGNAGRGSFVSSLVHRSITVTTGPLPTAARLAEYDAVLPGTAKVIRDEFQSQGGHRRFMEKFVVIINGFSQLGGLGIGGYLAWLSLSLAFELIRTGRSIEGFATFVGSVAALAGVFYLGKKRNTQSLAEKIGREIWDSIVRRQDTAQHRGEATISTLEDDAPETDFEHMPDSKDPAQLPLPSDPQPDDQRAV